MSLSLRRPARLVISEKNSGESPSTLFPGQLKTGINGGWGAIYDYLFFFGLCITMRFLLSCEVKSRQKRVVVNHVLLVLPCEKILSSISSVLQMTQMKCRYLAVCQRLYCYLVSSDSWVQWS